FFFQADDGIRDRNVTGVQTCALPIFVAVLLQPTEDCFRLLHRPFSRNRFLTCAQLSGPGTKVCTVKPSAAAAAVFDGLSSTKSVRSGRSPYRSVSRPNMRGSGLESPSLLEMTWPSRSEERRVGNECG